MVKYTEKGLQKEFVRVKRKIYYVCNAFFPCNKTMLYLSVVWLLQLRE